MIVDDPRIAESLAEACVERCLVLAARHWYETFSGPCTAPLECCRCAMPADSADAPCEMCGGTVFARMRPVRGRA